MTTFLIFLTCIFVRTPAQHRCAKQSHIYGK
jgi:hypothetical protein